MPKHTFFFGFLLTLAVCLSAPGLNKACAMGSKSGFEHADKKEPQKEHPVQGTEKGKGTEKGMQKKNAGGDNEKSPPAKKPRLKYLDPYECGC